MGIHVDLKYIHLLSPRLDRFKRVRDYLFNFRCPYCGDSEKFRNKARGYVYRVKDQLNFRCHNCDTGTTVGKLVQLLDSELYKEYVKEKWIGTETQTEYKFDTPVFKIRDPKLKDLVPINKLTSDHPAYQVLVERKIPEELYDQFYLCHKFYEWSEISSNMDHPRLVIPFCDEEGEVFAAQGRAFGNERPKYLTVKFQDRPKIFGLDRVDTTQPIMVVEGPIDSLFLENAIAVAGSDMLTSVNQFDKDQLVMVLDNEPRNREIIKKMEQLIDNNYSITIWPNSLQQKDINDMVLAGVKDIQKLVNQNTYQGLQARMEFANWKKI